MPGKPTTLSKANIVWGIRAFLWNTPLLQPAYNVYLAARYRGPHSTLVTRTSDVCIEAFPRSANTFMVQSLRLSTDRPIEIAHHLHSPLQIERSVKLGIPVVVILRNPIDCYTSFKIKTPQLSVEVMHRAYFRFHEKALRHAKDIHLVRYDDVITNTGKVIAQLHRWIGSGDEMVGAFDKNAVFKAIDEVKEQREGSRTLSDAKRFATTLARPTAEKEAAKHAVRAQIEQQYPELAASADRLYRQLLAQCVNI